MAIKLPSLKIPSIATPPPPTLPPTPALSVASSAPSSPILPSPGHSINVAASTSANLALPDSNMQYRTPRSARPKPTLEIGEVFALLQHLKGAAGLLSRTVESLGKAASEAESAGAALKASEQVEELRESLLTRLEQHNDAIMQLETELEERVRDALKDKLREHVYTQVQKSVEGKVKDKVAEKLKKHLVPVVVEETKTHTRRMLELEVYLENAEARRVNAMLGPDQPLRPLRRPVPPNLPTEELKNATAPSPNFPATVTDCGKLKDQDASDLARQYSLNNARLASSSPRIRQREGSPVHENNINKFLDHIGAPFHCLRFTPDTGSTSPVGGQRSKLFLIKRS